MRKTILFVDDDEGWREVVAVRLQDAGFEVLTAKDASEAMERAEGIELGLIILDLDLKGESGLALMRCLKRNHPDLPILLYTAQDYDNAAILAMLKEGAHQYLQKGSLEELIVAVGGYFK